METKCCHFDLKSIDEKGTFEGYAATFGNVDLGGDVILAGSFRKSLNDNGGDVPILWNHRDLIGRNLEAKEDSKGLWVRGQINLEVQAGREAYALAKQGAVKGLSIGYTVPRDKSNYDADGNRVLREVKWMEYSLTPFPLNPQAQVTSVKEQDETAEAVAALRGVQHRLSRVLGLK